MANKETALKGGKQWTAEHRYGDVFECSNGKHTLSHSKKGLEAAKSTLEANGNDSAMAQLKQVVSKLAAIDEAVIPAVVVDAAPTGEE